jgi:hypothetical protein
VILITYRVSLLIEVEQRKGQIALNVSIDPEKRIACGDHGSLIGGRECNLPCWRDISMAPMVSVVRAEVIVGKHCILTHD